VPVANEFLSACETFHNKQTYSHGLYVRIEYINKQTCDLWVFTRAFRFGEIIRFDSIRYDNLIKLIDTNMLIITYDYFLIACIIDFL